MAFRVTSRFYILQLYGFIFKMKRLKQFINIHYIYINEKKYIYIHITGHTQFRKINIDGSCHLQKKKKKKKKKFFFF
jgi:hypothetical protein